MPERRVTIVNELGLHARAAAKFVKLAQTFAGASVKVAKDEQQVSGSSILGLMMLAAGPGDQIDIAADGADGEAALAALADLVNRGFDEN